jgi:hypothetical protein
MKTLHIEAVGNEVRFWAQSTENERIRLLATSMVFIGKRMVLWHETGKMGNAAKLTCARVYKKDESAVGLINSFFEGFTEAVLYYSGHGPSGNYWGFYPDKAGYTIQLAPSENN